MVEVELQKNIVKCDWCDAELRRIPSQISRNKHNFCDSECEHNFRLVAHGKAVKTNCANCDKLIAVAKGKTKRFTNHFCCTRCCIAFHSGKKRRSE